ncbi:hypothetical protein AB0K35_27690 [Micromonospora sp. NPDC053740]|uniref:hypothetical protein n=1 Tax=Micromonospora sp. NPDC053740 TaxID=3155173 RepID=UPI0034370733
MTTPTGSGYAFRCEVCDSDPRWTITRIGDVATTWACDTDLAAACDRMQRDFEVTELRVTHYAKALEWAEVARTLAKMPNNPNPVHDGGRHDPY